MRKSIYYLVANTLSLIAAIIVIAVIDKNYPVFGLDLTVNALKNSFEPIKYVLIVEAIAIIFTTQDVVSSIEHKKSNSEVPFTTLKNTIMGIITVITILYTWLSVILEYNDYSSGSTIEIPYFFLGGFVIGLVMIFLSKLVNKVNDTVGASLVCSGLLLMVSGVLYELFTYWYCLLPCLLVTVLVLVVPSLISIVLRAKKAK